MKLSYAMLDFKVIFMIFNGYIKYKNCKYYKNKTYFCNKYQIVQLLIKQLKICPITSNLAWNSLELFNHVISLRNNYSLGKKDFLKQGFK